MSLEGRYFGKEEDEQDPYCYKGTSVLINELGIKDNEALNSYERALVSRRLLRLHLEPQIGDFSLSHYLGLHAYLFKGIYPFAGKIRSIDIIKGSTYFARHQYIEDNLEEVLNEMKAKLPTVRTMDEYSKELARFYIDLNLAHPFREGNGRCQREFFRQYVKSLNPILPFGELDLDYSRVDKDVFIQGVVANNDSVVKGELLNALVAKETIKQK